MKRGIGKVARTAALAALALAAAPAASQAQVTAQCVGGAIGCSQVNFIFGAALGSPSIQTLSLTIDVPGWRFITPLAYAGAEDAGGPLIFVPTTVTGTTLSGFFDIFEADPSSLVFTTEMDVYDGDAASLGFTYLAQDAAGGVVLSGSVSGTQSVVPEPASMVLLGTGLAGLMGTARRRRRERLDAAA